MKRCKTEGCANEPAPKRGICVPCRSAAKRAALRRRQDERLTPALLESLAPYGAQAQRAAAETLIRCGSIEAAAAEMHIAPAVLRGLLTELERKAARSGWLPGEAVTATPPSAFVPQGFTLKGTSTLLGPNGEIRGQWVKTQATPDSKLEQLADAIQALAEPLAGLAEPVAPPSRTTDDLLAVYPMGDPHFGMLAWAAETGDDFDLKIAESDLYGAMDQLVALAPPAKRALIIELGDFFHADNSTNQTLRSHHALDVDSRWAKIMRVGVNAKRRCIDRALEKHDEVEVKILIGNHDDHSAQMLALVLAAFYEREPRVRIDTSPSKFIWYEFGANLIGMTHGDTVKHADLPGVMAHDQPEAWGRTRYRRWYCGHIHHDTLKEYPGVIVETFRTLAARDAWHHAKGYRSGRDMKLDVVHREDGWIQRCTVDVPKIRKVQGGAS